MLSSCDAQWLIFEIFALWYRMGSTALVYTALSQFFGNKCTGATIGSVLLMQAINRSSNRKCLPLADNDARTVRCVSVSFMQGKMKPSNHSSRT